MLELGSSEWVKDEGGVPVRVPGKSVGELQFGRGVSLTVKKNGLEDVEVNVAEDAVDEVEEEEEEAPQVQATPRQSANFRASFGGSPGSAAIYSSPAYMRKAAKYSYLDGISRLFEDDWDNQDLPRKKARTSIGEVKSWKMVDKTPSPERTSSEAAAAEDQEMGEADTVEDTTAADMDAPPAAESIASQVTTIAEAPQKDQEPTTTAPVEAVGSQTVPPSLLANAEPKRQDATPLPATTLPRLQLPSASPPPQSSQTDMAAAPTIDPVTPRLVPLSSTTLPSTTPQISPLATKSAFGRQGLDGGRDTSQVVEIPERHAGVEATALASLKRVEETPMKEDRALVTENTFTAEPVTLEESESEDAPGSYKSEDLAEEDTFSDDEADEVLSAYEKDGEMMYEDDAEDVFDADGLEGEEPSDDETTEDPEMHQSPHGDQDMEDVTAEEGSFIERQKPARTLVQSDVTTQPTVSTPQREAHKQPSFAPASTLLQDKNTRVTDTKSPATIEQSKMTTPFKKPTFSADGVVPSTEFATPAARTEDTPKKTPQSARDKVMKRTFSSLFGIKGTPSPEKEDLVMAGNESNGEVKSEPQVDQPIIKPDASEVDVSSSQRQLHMGLDGQSESEETNSPSNPPPITHLTEQASLEKDHDAHGVDDMRSVAAGETSEQQEDDELQDASPRLQMSKKSPPAELINLDSDSDKEAEVEEVEEVEQSPDMREPSPPTLASAVEEHSDADSNAPSVQRNSVEVAVFKPILVNAEEASGEHDASEQQQSSDKEHGKEEAAASNDDDQEVISIRPSEAPEPVRASLDTAIPDSMQQPTESPPVTLSPEPEVQTISFEPEQITQDFPEQSQPFDLVADVADLARDPEHEVNDHETQAPDSAQPSPFQQVEQVGSPSVTPKKISNPDNVGQNNMVEIGDVDMLDAQELERQYSHSSFESQAMQDNIDPQHKEPDSPLASFESQVVQESIDTRRQEIETPLASFASQVAQDTIDAQMSGMNEHSSRPTSRDTVEDFSPVRLGSFSERISGLVNETRAIESQDEPEVIDSTMLEETKPEDSGVHATNLPVDAMESPIQDAHTPSRVTKHSIIVELDSSPSSFGEFSPAKIERSTQQQVLTPKATLPEEEAGEQKDDSMADETLIEQQLASELIEDPVGSDTQPLEAQRSAQSIEQHQSLDRTNELSAEQVEQASHQHAEATPEVPEHPILPMTPSATQLTAAEPEARLSHASVVQAVVEPVSSTSSSQPDSNLQSSLDPETTKAPEETSIMPQAKQAVQEKTDMPPPEQSAPPKTPARKSLRSRLSNVPDVISAWFSPKRSSVAAQEAEKPTEIETPAASTADVVQNGSARKRHVAGIATAHTYFTSLASLEKRLNPSGEQTGAVDVLAIVADSTAKEPGRAKGGPRDYYTIFKIMDPSIPTSSPVRVEVFRPWKAVLPAADVGDVVLLRGFVVKSKKRQPYLLSTDSSAWCVWRFAEHNEDDNAVIDKATEKSVRTRRMSHIDVREEVKGPPVEYGFVEKEEARKLRDWWIETHGDSQGGASEEAVGNVHSEETDAVES